MRIQIPFEEKLHTISYTLGVSFGIVVLISLIVYGVSIIALFL